jgi:multisubunit Na+/H+ antiporter MnhE subunit
VYDHSGGGTSAAVRIVLAWAVLFGLWQLYVGQTTTQTTIAGVIAATLATGAALLLARFGLFRFGLDPRRLRRAATLPWDVVRDFALVTLALTRGRPGGAFREVDVPARTAGDRAFAGLLESIAPNAYVVDIDRDRGTALVHELDSR